MAPTKFNDSSVLGVFETMSDIIVTHIHIYVNLSIILDTCSWLYNENLDFIFTLSICTIFVLGACLMVYVTVELASVSKSLNDKSCLSLPAGCTVGAQSRLPNQRCWGSLSEDWCILCLQTYRIGTPL